MFNDTKNNAMRNGTMILTNTENDYLAANDQNMKALSILSQEFLSAIEYIAL